MYTPASSQLKTFWGEVFGAKVDKVCLRIPGVCTVGVSDPNIPSNLSFW